MRGKAGKESYEQRKNKPVEKGKNGLYDGKNVNKVFRHCQLNLSAIACLSNDFTQAPF